MRHPGVWHTAARMRCVPREAWDQKDPKVTSTVVGKVAQLLMTWRQGRVTFSSPLGGGTGVAPSTLPGTP